ncbi:hypothetical protein GGS20DRAFT_586675 [Poronia punctata]|nr:hypothetical protein GGS20DRAFT_586675 [Poronia punctata]
MGKVKQTNGKAAKAADPLTSVKKAGVTKAADSPKVKSKQVAKEVAVKAVNGKAKDLKKKKKVETESESSDSDSDSDAEDSDDSESDSESAAADSSDSDSDSDDSDSDKKPAAKKAKVAAKVEAKPATNGKATKKVAEPESSDSSDSSDDESEEVDAKKTNTKAETESSDDDSDDSSDSDKDSDSEEVEEKKPEPSKKRKAEEEVAAPLKKNKTENESGDQYTTLFAGNLGWGITDDSLYEAFKDCEGLSSARVVTDRAMQRSRGFGYVDFESHEAAKAAFEKMQGFELEGRALNLDPSKPRPAGEEPTARANDRAKQFGDQVSPESDTLFVGNLPFEVDEDAIGAFFGEVAEVKSIRLPKDPESGNPKGFGYVTFNSIDEAKSVFDAKNGAYIGEGRASRAIRLDFAGQRPPREGGGFGGGRGGGGGGFGGRGGGRGGGGFGGRGGGGRGGGGFGGRGGGGRGGGGRGGFGGGRGGKPFEGKKITF